VRPLLTVALQGQRDVVLARQRVRQVAQLLGMDARDAVRVATAVSEIARNVFEHGGGGRVEVAVTGRAPHQRLEARFADAGPGIPHLDRVMDGTWRSERGLGLGMVGARRLVDGMEVDAPAGRGTRVTLWKALPPRAPAVDDAAAAQLAARLAAERPGEAGDEVRVQNQELLQALGELRERQEELVLLNRELEDTNRGVVALHAELEQQAEELRRANRLQAQFLSYVSHEFRTPLDAMLALAGLLLEQVDGPLNAEQDTQVRFLRSSAADLLQMVDELLDTARVEAGHVEVRPGAFTAGELFAALRATFRPLHATEAVALVFEDPAGVPPLCTDEGKVAQVLRNLVANALKFTRAGEVRVRARDGGGGFVAFTVADTGLGIPPDHLERIFQDFAQVPSPVQRRVRGTGLGLPLSRRLAELLGGSLTVESAEGAGSTFTLRIPAIHPACGDPAGASEAP
jgi:signal transduction histidine kinase